MVTRTTSEPIMLLRMKNNYQALGHRKAAPNKRSRTQGRNGKYLKPVHTDTRIDTLMSDQAVPRGRLYCRRAQLFLRRFTQRGQKRTLCHRVREDLRWWLDAIKGSSIPLYKTEITHFLTTDYWS